MKGSRAEQSEQPDDNEADRDNSSNNALSAPRSMRPSFFGFSVNSVGGSPNSNSSRSLLSLLTALINDGSMARAGQVIPAKHGLAVPVIKTSPNPARTFQGGRQAGPVIQTCVFLAIEFARLSVHTESVRIVPNVRSRVRSPQFTKARPLADCGVSLLSSGHSATGRSQLNSGRRGRR